jgi:cyclic pyranopterin phosphate synthase
MLRDRFNRKIDYLRLSVTDRCDLRCTYCIPKGFKQFDPTDDYLGFDEIERVVAAFGRLGVERVRLTGGEPLTRKGVVGLAERIARQPGIHDISLTTNATRLARHAADLKRAGVKRLNVSLDSLDRTRIQRITGHDVLPQVLEGLEAARTERFDLIKINVVALAGVNDDEDIAMAEYCRERGFVLRFIEVMPMGDSGRSVAPADLQRIRSRLQSHFDMVDGLVPGGGPARYLKSKDGSFSVGFITPLTQHFCALCNRVRLSADGVLFMCLGQNDTYDLRPLLRAGCSDGELEQAIRQAVDLKPSHHDFNAAPEKTVRIMAKTGG